MYRVTVRNGWDGAEHTIHSENLNDTKLLTAKITRDIDAIDSFQFSISPESPYYNEFHGMTTFVKVTIPKRNQVLFEGRVLPTTDSMATSGEFNKEITCEGLLAFLHDSTQDYYALANNDLKSFLQHMIDVHNRQVDAFKKIKLGQVTVTSPSDNVYKSIDDSKTTYETIKDKLITKYGGEIRLRHEPDGLYLDYMPEIAIQSNQEIRLASNLLSIKRAIDPSAMYSIIKPLGARAETTMQAEEGESDISQPRLTIETVNAGSPFLISQKLVDQIGRVVHSEVWDDVKVAAILKSKGQAMLDSQREIKEQFQATAVDLSLLSGMTVDSFECGNYYQTINPLMGIDERLRIVGQSLDLCEPLNSTLSIGDKLLGQADYEALIKKQGEAIDEIKSRVAAQTAKIVTISNELGEIGSIKEAQSTQDELIKELQEQVQKLQEQTVGDQYYEGSIIDVSEFQGTIDWSKVVNAGLALSVIRVQSGSSHIDTKYSTNITNAISAGANYAVYAYFAATDPSDATVEANDFYNRTKAVVGSSKEPRFWMIDVEADSTRGTLSSSVTAYMNKLNSLGIPDSKIVIYVSNALYPSIDARRTMIWIPSYGINDGTIANSTKPKYPYDLWQYTSKGVVDGITENTVDMSTQPSDRFKKSYLVKG
ncbi:GH25 family lysozyme [Latilactobacillus sakei]|uniref:GH25 family lysozyme n=2 Tax=Latilactobacillus sakei TaxID=1599 RepID=UPI0009772313|nr:GH25 family lysozyme [Latilactobacillus sakei]